jgi:hypothetical protein
MIGITLASVVVMVVASYVLKDTPRQGGFVKTTPSGLSQQNKKEYYPTGELRAEGMMDGYYKEGEWIYYRKDGSVELVEYYHQGNVVDSSALERK